MSTRISLPIEPHKNGTHCGDCPSLDWGETSPYICGAFGIPYNDKGPHGPARDPKCLAAEKAHKILTECAKVHLTQELRDGVNNWSEWGLNQVAHAQKLWEEAGLGEIPQWPY